MPKIKYEQIKFKPETLKLLVKADQVLAQYAAQGYDVTLRQLYYYFVANDLFPDEWMFSWDTSKKKWYRDLENGTKNAEPNYKNFGNILNDGRMAGYIDWNHLVDRGRNLKTHPAWDSPAHIVQSCADQFQTDMWKEQQIYVEVWVEKEALIGVIERPCLEWRVPYFACKGYTSQSEAWNAGRRLMSKREQGKDVVIIHLGDHDPSGIDMTRDVKDRLDLFSSYRGTLGTSLTIDRIALNMDQVRQYDPPPNPTKLTDTRANSYIDRFGEECWELDALTPDVIHGLVENRIKGLVDMGQWNKDNAREIKSREELSSVAENWDGIIADWT